MDQILGYIERITFQNPTNGYTVAQLKQKGKRDPTCVVGIMPSVQPGETVRCFGEWKRHLVHGLQFEVKECRIELPADVVGIRKYLGSGLIKGIGPVYASRIVDAFGTTTLEIIDQNPDKLLEIQGLGPGRLGKIKDCWEAQKSIREVMIFLQTYGISPAYAQKIYKKYGNQSAQKVKENPYALAREIFGIGFKIADSIASKMGIDKQSPQRIDAGIVYVLAKLSDDGHVCYPLGAFVEAAAEVLEVEKGAIADRIQAIAKDEQVIVKDLVHEGSLQSFIWEKFLYIAEQGAAREIRRLLRNQSMLRPIKAEAAVDWVQTLLGIRLAPNQKDAVIKSLTEKVHIITGGPGTGKSTITNAILNISGKLTSRILLAAPTGRAAKRMSEITSKKAQTIHSLLEVDMKGGGFKRNRENPLECDLLIIDEASMIDTPLMYHLLKAIPSHARVVFVGDINQLPSVGPGNVLKDMITSRCIPVTLLTEIFRQGKGSRIVTNAHLINKGALPELRSIPDSDFYFVEAADPEHVLSSILSLVTQRLPQKYRYDPFRDIQVLAPMKKGAIGTENLNVMLQEVLNPKNPGLIRFGKKLAVGDKVMQIRNNYQKEVYNGDVGRITKIDFEESELTIEIDEKQVVYDFSDLDEVTLAYAVSVHKYQGSECPCIVMPVHTSHFKLLHRNLLYTGVTRGKKLVILVGTKKALAIAVRNDEVQKRFTGLLQAFLEANSPLPSVL